MLLFHPPTYSPIISWKIHRSERILAVDLRSKTVRMIENEFKISLDLHFYKEKRILKRQLLSSPEAFVDCAEFESLKSIYRLRLLQEISMVQLSEATMSFR